MLNSRQMVVRSMRASRTSSTAQGSTISVKFATSSPLHSPGQHPSGIHILYPVAWSPHANPAPSFTSHVDRFLVEPIPEEVRDYFKTVVCTALAPQSSQPHVIKAVAKSLTRAPFLDACLADLTLVPFALATYESQSQALSLMDWQNTDHNVLYWQVSLE